MKTVKEFSDTAIRAYKKAAAGNRDEYEEKHSPLRLVVTDTGHKSFVVRRRMRGASVSRRYKVGEYPAMSLAEARERAGQFVVLLRQGIDPREHERALQAEREAAGEAARTAGQRTFRAAAEAYIKAAVIGADPSTPKMRKWREVKRDIEREFVSRWGDRPIADVQLDDVRDVLAEIEKRAPIQARNLLISVRGLFAWAVVQGKKYGLRSSPCASLKPKYVFSESKELRDRVLTDDELRAFWAVMIDWEAKKIPAVPVYRLLLLTGLRLNEIAKAQWDEFDLANGQWIIPARRMKGVNGKVRDHLVALTDEMVEILNGIKRFSGPFVFTTTAGRKPISMSSKLKERLDRAMLAKLRESEAERAGDAQKVFLDDWINHDLRRTVSTRITAIKDQRITEETREAFIAHTKQGTAKHYNIYKFETEKRLIGESWSMMLHTVLEPPTPGDKVVQLTARV